MDGLIQLVRAYREATSVDGRLSIGEEVIQRIVPEIQLFIFAAIPNYAMAADVTQETLLAIARGLSRFRGDTAPEFWGWANQIARNKINDHFRRHMTEAERVQPLPPDELRQVAEASVADHPMSPQDRLDLEYAMKLLARSSPECLNHLWKFYVLGFDYAELAAERGLSYDAIRMKGNRCLETARSLIAKKG